MDAPTPSPPPPSARDDLGEIRQLLQQHDALLADTRGALVEVIRQLGQLKSALTSVPAPGGPPAGAPPQDPGPAGPPPPQMVSGPPPMIYPPQGYPQGGAVPGAAPQGGPQDIPPGVMDLMRMAAQAFGPKPPPSTEQQLSQLLLDLVGAQVKRASSEASLSELIVRSWLKRNLGDVGETTLR